MDERRGESITEPTDDQSSPADEKLSLDYVFEILKNERRRRVLAYLREHDERVTLSDLAEHIAALENDTDVASITSSQRKRVYVGLYQCHLPKMDDMDVVDFNQNRGIIERGPNAEQLYEYLDNGSEDRTDWPKYYLATAVTGIAYSGLALAGAVGSAVVASVGFLVLCTAMGGCAVAHTMAATETEDGTELGEQLLTAVPTR